MRTFCYVVKAEGEQVRRRLGYKKKKTVSNKRGRRFHTKIITKEVRVLQVLRILKNLSQRKASSICGYHKKAIGVIENGRVELSETRIVHIVKSYGFTMEDFERHMKSEVLITEIQDECISIIKGLCEKNLKAVHPLLLNFLCR